MEPYYYQYRRRRSLHNNITESINQLPPPPPLTLDITSHEPEKLKHDNEEDKEEEDDDYIWLEEDEEEIEDKHEEGADGDAKCKCKQSKSEKKSRKAILKLGFQPISGVHRVTLKKNNDNMTCVISEPIVFKSSTSETYVILGQAKLEEIGSEMLTEEDLKAPYISHVVSELASSAMLKEDEGVDESKMDPRDIELVMAQTGLSWENAVKALKVANNDIVTAIMEHITK